MPVSDHSTKPLCSIIVPVYNPGDRLRACLESILSQTIRDWELILVDDGSTDGSAAVCDAYAAKDARIRVIHTPNRGPGAARNSGVADALAPRITFIDSDDTVAADYLSCLLAPDAPDGSLVMTGIREVFEDGRPDKIPYQFDTVITTDDISRLDHNIRILHLGYPCAKLFDASLLRALPFDTRLRMHEDHILYLQYLLRAGKLILVPGTPYHYYHASATVSLTRRTKSTEEWLREAEGLTEAMLAVREKYPDYPERAFSRAITQFGLHQWLEALRSCGDRRAFLDARSRVMKYKKLFFKHLWHGKRLFHNWITFLAALCGFRIA